VDNFNKGNERIENLNRGGYQIIQNSDAFCFGLDAVLLAWYASQKIKKSSRVIDLGTGTGILPLLICGRTSVQHVEALEIQPEMAEMANRSVFLNHLEDRIQIHCDDLRNPTHTFHSSYYDVVVSNPPYMPVGKGDQNLKKTFAIARHEVSCTLDDIARFAFVHLKDRGKLFMVHKADRLVDILSTLRTHQLEPKRLKMIQPFADQPANLVLIEAIRRGQPRLEIAPPLIVYQRPNCYTEEINQIYGTDKPATSKSL